MRVRAYDESDAAAWDECCARSYMATFLHSRRFLSYHGDRFEDFSLILEDGEHRLLGIIPAARHPVQSDCVVSHPGITYGGIVHDGSLRGERMLEALVAVTNYYRDAGFKRLIYKTVPYIYHQSPAQDDLYALFRLGATRTRCDISSAIDIRNRLPVSQRRKRCLKKATELGIKIFSGIEHADSLWNILTENLQRKHDASPVHTLDEIRWLAERFGGNIRFVVASHENCVVAGVVMFVSARVHHAQYIASSQVANQHGVLDAVFEHCIRNAQMEDASFFDFGISTEKQGMELNPGLFDFKSSFGSGGVAYEFYEINCSRSN